MSREPRDLARLLKLVTAIVNGFCRKVPAYVDREELMGAGLLGLADALRRRPDAELESFAPYAHTRIRGAIQDYLRGIDPLGRTWRDEVRKDPDAERELPVRARVDYELTIADSAPSPEEQAEEQEQIALLRSAAARLPWQCRRVFVLRLRGLEFHLIGKRMGFTESRACQLWHEAVGRLTAELGEQE